MPATLFRKPVLAPGSYHTSTGKVEITPSRIRGFADKFKKMTSAGLKIPMPWGHQLKANPISQADIEHNEFAKSKYNAGYVKNLEVDAKSGELVLVAEPPPGFTLDGQGNLVNAELGTKIGEVSAAITNWKDGSGKEWPDSIRHIAITPLPVDHKRTGFEPIQSEFATGEIYLSLMALEETHPEPVINPGKGGADKDGQAKRLVEIMGRCGVTLPADTGSENILERLEVALTALEGKIQAAAKTEEVSNDDDDEQEDDEMPSEEPRMQFSLDKITDPVMLALAKRCQADDQKKRASRIEALKRRGLSPAIADQLVKDSAAIQFSLNEKNEVQESEIDRQLSLLENVLEEEEFTDTYLSTKAVVAQRPEIGKMDRETAKKIADEMALAGGLPARRK